MATSADIAALRRAADEPGTETYTDAALSAYVDTAGSVDGAAAVVWREKAAKASTLVNVSESGSSRSMQQVYQNAIDMAKFYETRSGDIGVIDAGDAPFTIGTKRL